MIEFMHVLLEPTAAQVTTSILSDMPKLSRFSYSSGNNDGLAWIAKALLASCPSFRSLTLSVMDSGGDDEPLLTWLQHVVAQCPAWVSLQLN
jgi:hypothetical protein